MFGALPVSDVRAKRKEALFRQKSRKMVEKLVGKWLLVESDNFDAYLKQVGVGLVTRKMATTLKPTLTFSHEGDKWKMVSESTFKTIVTEFTVGQEFDETTGDGRTLKALFTIEGDKLIQTQKPIKKDDKESRFERYVDENGQLVIICESGGVVCKRVYKKAE